MYASNPAVVDTLHRVKLIRHAEADEAVLLWVSQAPEDGITITGNVLREKWCCFAISLKIPYEEWPRFSEGWLTRFKKQNGLREQKKHGEAGSQSTTTADAERR